MNRSENIYQCIQVDLYSATPKYLQLSQSVVSAVQEGKLKQGYVLPSINDLSYELELSRSTVERAYRQLKEMGLIQSFPGKGYFISGQETLAPERIFLLFNKLSAHKKIIYDAFIDRLGSKASVDFYVYNNDMGLFRSLLERAGDRYNWYVVIPHFVEGGEQAPQVINSISSGKLILLDKLVEGVNSHYGAVYEDFEQDIRSALAEALPRLRKYRRLKMIFPEQSYFPVEIMSGFEWFCVSQGLEYKMVHDLLKEPINEGDVFINLMEDHLVLLLERIRETDLEVGKDVGIISYNETPWKKFILNGITTISTDFQAMGMRAAEMILERRLQQIPVPFTLRVRQSL